MSGLRSAVNRAALLVTGGLAVLTGAALASTADAVRRRLPAGWARLDPDRVWLDGAALDRWRAHAWWPAAVIAVLALGVLAFGAWAAYGIRPGRLRRLPLGDPRPPKDGGITLSGTALAAALTDRARSTPGVDGARVRLLGRPRRLRAHVTVTLAPGAAPAAVLQRLARGTLAEARESVAPRTLRTEIHFEVRPHAARRLR
ncbi:hypothetical protein [Streptomyces spectabilis]|uniref:Alkaline shock response membrane anchor protein AmaP n=1 Tax=Streptomyces spectabilis TaxID=68270 RepID=A0A516RJM9_STRST|nr:hypothetical protein [Streptomyces spectabilis]QDQ15853.1 hypothetical protein FH965_39270 [Streptomyces spectabilis]